jgi:Rrf2 family protein
MLSKSCIYGIRALLYLTLHTDRQYVSIKEISQTLGISFHFLTKILQTLTENNILISFKGPKGGVSIAKNPESISILDIVKILDGDSIFEDCLLGLTNCSSEKPCPLHHLWSIERSNIKSILENANLKELSKKIIDEELRIHD